MSVELLLIILICIVIGSVFYLKNILESSLGKKEDQMSKSDIEGKFTDVGTSITNLQTSLSNVVNLTRDDVTKSLKEFELIFRSSQERGNFGEYQIEQLLSSLGLIEGTHWKQKQKHKEHGTIPDYTFYFPDGVFVNLDSKFPLAHYKNMFSEGISEVDKNEEKKKFRVDVKGRINELKKPGYIDVSNSSVDFVLMLLPSDSVLNFVRKEFEKLDVDAREHHIFIIGINELYAILLMLKRAIHNFKVSEGQNEINRLFENFKTEWKKRVELFETYSNRLRLAAEKYEDIEGFNNELDGIIKKMNLDVKEDNSEDSEEKEDIIKEE